MMNTYREQIMNLCIQTYYNLYGVMPDAQELAEMIGEDVAPLDENRGPHKRPGKRRIRS